MSFTQGARGLFLGSCLSLLVVAAGCESSSDVEKGGEGESCVRRDDCSGSLVCIDNRCATPMSATAGGADGGTMQVDTRGKEGESCTRRADCQSMLACVDQVCVMETSLTDTPLQVRGERGESCQARNDCREGLACVGGRCRENDYTVTVQTKECYRVECATTEDCCADFVPSSSCANYKSLCDGGDTVYCNIYETSCKCQLTCQDELCAVQNTCTVDTDCGSSLLHCYDMKCAQCKVTADCATFDPEATCIDGVCTAGCKQNEDCPLFDECQSGKCVEVGCKSDRECLFATEDPLSKCVDKECITPCTNDAECTSPFHVCENSKCVFVGCESDEECRVLLNLQPGTFGGGSSTDMAVCRAPK